jgi:hypothetical protein
VYVSICTLCLVGVSKATPCVLRRACYDTQGAGFGALHYASFNFTTIDKMLNLTYIKNSTVKNSDVDNYRIDDVHCMHIETCTYGI